VSFLLTGMAPSRAGSLPQGNACQIGNVKQPKEGLECIPNVGASLLAKRPLCPAQIFRFKRGCLKDTCRHGLKATNPCAIAYSQARIRRLVRFGVGFYCGSVADESAIGFSDSNSSQRCIGVPGFVADQYFRDFVMVAVCGRPSGLPGAFDRFANLRTAATPPV
jgi:hypothetical protein